MKILVSLKQVQNNKLVEMQTAYIDENKAYHLDGQAYATEAGEILSNADCKGLGLVPSDKYVVRIVYPIQSL